MNRKAGSSISREKAQRSEQAERNNYDPSHVDFAMRPSGESLIVCVSKKVLFGND
jgi:hypothetical protein